MCPVEHAGTKGVSMRAFGKCGAAAGFLFLTSAVLLPAGVAFADPDPALAGDCAKTLGADSGKALTVDAGAPVNQPRVLTAGTGTPAANDPALNLDVASLTHGLRVDQLPAVTDVCDTAQGTVNTLSATTQTLLRGENPAPPSTPPARPTPPAPAPPPQQLPDQGGSAALGGSSFVVFALSPTSPSAGWDVGDLLAPQSLVAPPETDALPPTGTGAGPGAPLSGTALALPMPPDRLPQLPLLLAAATLSVVGALLAHTWFTRRPD